MKTFSHVRRAPAESDVSIRRLTISSSAASGASPLQRGVRLPVATLRDLQEPHADYAPALVAAEGKVILKELGVERSLVPVDLQRCTGGRHLP